MDDHDDDHECEIAADYMRSRFRRIPLDQLRLLEEAFRVEARDAKAEGLTEQVKRAKRRLAYVRDELARRERAARKAVN